MTLTCLFYTLGVVFVFEGNLQSRLPVLIFAFGIFALANALKAKIYKGHERMAGTAGFGPSDQVKKPFIFLGADIRRDMNMPAADEEAQERYIILAGMDLHVKRIVAALSLTVIFYFCIRARAYAPVDVLRSSIFLFTVLWFHFKIYHHRQMKLIILINWIFSIFFFKAVFLNNVLIFPYAALSFFLLKGERPGRWNLSVPLSNAALLLMIWVTLLTVFNSRKLDLHLGGLKLFNSFQMKPIQVKKKSRPINFAKMLPTDLSGANIDDLNRTLDQMEKLAEEARAVGHFKLAQQDLEQMDSSLKSMRENLGRLNGLKDRDFSKLSKSTLDKINSDFELLKEDSEKMDVDSMKTPLPSPAEAQELEKEKQATMPEKKKAPRDYKKLFIKIALILAFALFSLFFSRKSEKQEREPGQATGHDDLLRQWKRFLATKPGQKKFIFETYFMLSQVNADSLLGESAFIPPLKVQEQLPVGKLSLEWPTIAKGFLKSYYGERSLTEAEVKQFYNSAVKCFKVTWEKR